ncbi:MAG: NADH:ubiquinone oxidoreductase [Alistipes sp.]|nr:NADH:ubiquinone oxidoreductase [Alistipes sp.]
MFLSQLKVLRSHGRQTIKHLSGVELPTVFRGRPVIRPMDKVLAGQIEAVCPSGAFVAEPLAIDLGRCALCGECAAMSAGAIVFTNDYRMASNRLENLIVKVGTDGIVFDPDAVRQQVCSRYRRSLRLREVSAGGDNSTEMELGASMNVNFDFGRYGVEFTASPRHADGLVITGPVTQNMHTALDICYCSVAEPKIVIAAGYDAISGGIFAGSPALNREFFRRISPDLYLPGNSVHPMTFIDGVAKLLRRKLR